MNAEQAAILSVVADSFRNLTEAYLERGKCSAYQDLFYKLTAPAVYFRPLRQRKNKEYMAGYNAALEKVKKHCSDRMVYHG